MLSWQEYYFWLLLTDIVLFGQQHIMCPQQLFEKFYQLKVLYQYIICEGPLITNSIYGFPQKKNAT